MQNLFSRKKNWAQLPVKIIVSNIENKIKFALTFETRDMVKIRIKIIEIEIV